MPASVEFLTKLVVCPPEHWGLLDASTGIPIANNSDAVLRKGISGFRPGNADSLFPPQSEKSTQQSNRNLVNGPLGTNVDQFERWYHFEYDKRGFPVPA